MKKLVIIWMCILSPVLVWGQDPTEEKELELDAVPLYQIERNGNEFAFRVMESYAGEFEEDPLQFVHNYFDVHGVFGSFGKDRPDQLSVNFRDSRGTLDVTYDKEGHLNGNFHKCKDVLVPMAVRRQLLKDHEGWTMVKNVHISRGKADVVEDEFFRIKLKKGNEIKRVKISMDDYTDAAISSISHN